MGRKKKQDTIRFIADEDHTILQRYFEEVGSIYEDLNLTENELEHNEENRDKIIKSNLKCVIKVAKHYLNRGLTLEELISAGNEGLCIAFDKYNADKNKYRDELLKKIDELEDDNVPREWVATNIGSICQYGKYLDSYNKHFASKKTDSFKKDTVRRWVQRNISCATFNSVAMMWVNALIRQDLMLYSKVIKQPANNKNAVADDDVEIYDERPNSDGVYAVNTALPLLYDDSEDEVDTADRVETCHSLLKTLFAGVPVRHRRIIMMAFGIGYVRAFKPREIAHLENIGAARVSQIMTNTIERMRENAAKNGISYDKITELLSTD